MLAIKKSEKSTSCVANVLPCRIQHNGPVNATTRHWTPESSSDGQTNTAYFRGRKLNGKTVNLPEGYRGAILQKTNTILPPTITPSTSTSLEDEEDASSSLSSTPETKILQEVATFDKIVVWGHEVQPDGQEDVYVRGVSEWIGLATAMNSFDD
ncbi:ribonuclease H1 small subunit [Aureobasidium pullulans]|uniref:Ribonuclease H1 small subunit n=1 Tax=Aureobasidium pullulans TaxID=5580 RepID=A0A4S9EPR9_AURPU|nr:ribonuclease H1 small subunit [Aureobasidium pullulans]THW20741.1 ribonuclease H1 small subunit [Aureobasidium pullulans]THW65883.1 ribonuclease H1 small subunit [Aureobasidium pullulans]THX10910.1 ribonuclease H1 small subunit [Aureobasidium pullulans]THX36721.1 ribonuclease H1 small subunit [Aureobasidium pullulans]